MAGKTCAALDRGGAAPHSSGNLNDDADQPTRPFGPDQATGWGAIANPLLDAALAYAEHGLPVFPLRGKMPVISREAGGRGVHDAAIGADQIRAWWDRWPGANIGLATGAPSALWALDVDPAKGGEDSLAALEADHGPLPETVEQITGSNGRHLLFAYHGEPIKNRAGERGGIGPGLDTRATGGYIVAAPSVHPETGRPYRWRDGCNPLTAPPVPAPGWLLALVVDRTEPPPPASTPKRPPARFLGPKPAHAHAALDGAARRIAEVRPSAQEATLNGEAYSIGRLIGAGLMPADFARAVLVRAGTMMMNGDPRRPWRRREIEAKVDRALEQGRRNPRASRGPRP